MRNFIWGAKERNGKNLCCAEENWDLANIGNNMKEIGDWRLEKGTVKTCRPANKWAWEMRETVERNTNREN